LLKRLIAAVIIVSMLVPQAFAEPSGAPGVSAKNAIVMSADGEVLYEKSADERALIASTTKIMTAILTIENCNLDDVVTVSSASCGIEGSSMYLSAGDKLTVRELLLGLILVSGNDAAHALAMHTAGSLEAFVGMMNAKASALSMHSSSFANPHGLNAEGHYSTARDMARLMVYCMENERFAEIMAVQSCEVSGQTLLNHNKLLRLYPYCTGGKTGYTEAAGRCLVSCSEREGQRIVCVTFSAPDDWNDHIKLYDYAYSNYSVRDLYESACFELPVVSGTESTVEIVPQGEMKLYLPNEAQIVLVAEMPHFVFAPVRSCDSAGRLTVKINDKIYAQYELRYKNDVPLRTRAASLRYTVLELA